MCKQVSWLKDYRIYCDLFDWSNEQCMLNLHCFLNYSLNRILLNELESDCPIKFNDLKKFPIDFVDDLLRLGEISKEMLHKNLKY